MSKSNAPKGAMSSPYGSNFLNDFTVRNTDYVKEPEPFTDKEFENIKKKFESVGAVFKAKGKKLIVFELGGNVLYLRKN